MKRNNAKDKKAQSPLEYAVIICLVVTALGVMNLYVQRAIKANLKMTEYEINAEKERTLPTYNDSITYPPPENDISATYNLEQ